MKRFHVHISVKNLDQNIQFYSTLFGQKPTVEKEDYAKWMLENPRVNFAISKRTLVGKPGINHLGVQAETAEELDNIHTRLTSADQKVVSEGDVECCYAKSEKHWVKDPQGVAWETFRSLDTVEHYYGDDLNAAPTGVSLINKAEKNCSTWNCLLSKVKNRFQSGSACCG